MRPLDPLSSIKMKLGAVIVAAVAVTVLVVSVGTGAGASPVVSALAAGALSLGLVQVLAHGMTSPLREMAAAAAAMARGDYRRRVTASSRDEVGELARAFNGMATQLGEVDRIRRELVANVSHELRTPITALQAVLEILVDGVEPANPETMRTMLRQVERLGTLVAQLLDLSRLESGAVPLQRRSFELGPLLEEAAGETPVADDRRARGSQRRPDRRHRRGRPGTGAPGPQQPARQRRAPLARRRHGRAAGHQEPRRGDHRGHR